MNDFIKIYLKIINESKFKDLKWKFDKIYESIEIYENYKHLKERLKERYSEELESWIIWNTIKIAICDYLLKNDAWNICRKKSLEQRSYVCHLTKLNIWCCFIIQNDVKDDKIRIYFSTFLPNVDTKLNSKSIKFDLPL